MKLSTWLLLGSLGANGALLVLLAVGIASEPAPVPGAREKTAAPVVGATPAATAAEAWSELQGGELAVQVERLRAEGFPPAVIRAIAAARIREGFAARRQALEAALAEQPFWLTHRDPKLLAEQRALTRDEQKALREVLGPDPENGAVASLRRSLPNLPLEKAEQIAALQESYNEKRAGLMNGGRAMLPEDNEKINALEKALHAEIAALLTPQELEDYDLRLSQTASSLRYNLVAFDPTEQEFRAIFKLQSAFEQQWGRMYAIPSRDEMRLRSEAQRELGEQIKAALGAERYADYQRSTDFNYRRTAQLVTRLDLPAQTARDVYAIQQDIQQRANDVRRGAAPGDFRTQLADLTTEAETRITAKLGAQGFEAYKQFSGSWLQNLAPRTAPMPKK